MHVSMDLAFLTDGFFHREKWKIAIGFTTEALFYEKKIQNVDNLMQKHIRNKHKSTIQVFKDLHMRPLLKISDERIRHPKSD